MSRHPDFLVNLPLAYSRQEMLGAFHVASMPDTRESFKIAIDDVQVRRLSSVLNHHTDLTIILVWYGAITAA